MWSNDKKCISFNRILSLRWNWFVKKFYSLFLSLSPSPSSATRRVLDRNLGTATDRTWWNACHEFYNFITALTWLLSEFDCGRTYSTNPLKTMVTNDSDLSLFRVRPKIRSRYPRINNRKNRTRRCLRGRSSFTNCFHDDKSVRDGFNDETFVVSSVVMYGVENLSWTPRKSIAPKRL